MKAYFSFLLFSVLLSCVSARVQIPPIIAACQTVTGNYLLSNCTKNIYYTPECQCNSQPWLGTMALCVSENGPTNTHEQEHAWDYVHTYCVTLPESDANTVSMEAILTNATNTVVPLPRNATTDILHSPIRLPQSKVSVTLRTVKEFNDQLQYGITYGAASSAFVFGFLGLGMLNNLFHHCFDWRYDISLATTKSLAIIKPKALPASPKWMQFIRRHIINPSFLFNGVHLQNATWFGFKVSYPSRLESIVIFLFVALNIILLFPNYNLFAENTYWPDDLPLQLGRYLADRSGEMSFAQLPMVYLFGGRNNMLIWLTGWSYDRFIIAHKWVSRVMMLHAIIHSAAYTWYPLHFGYDMYVSYYEDLYFVWGVVATVIGSFILLFAIPDLRRACYDLFLYSHIVLVVLFTVGCWYHVSLLNDEENMMWLYAAVAVWAFDRVARLLRVIYYNIMLVTGQRFLRSVKAEILPGTDCIRFRVDANKSGLSQRIPGAFVYIYVPRVYFWQSHPFTIASWHQPSLDKQPIVPSDAGVYGTTAITNPAIVSDSKKPPLSASLDSAIMAGTSSEASSSSSSSSSSSLSNPSYCAVSGKSFDLLIRPQKGMTKKLYEAVEKLGPNGGEMYVLIEGPYGHSHPVLQYNTAILVGGGVGCTATVPYLQEAVFKARQLPVRHVVFIWVVQQDDQLSWAQHDIEECVTHVNLNKMRQTATGEESMNSSDSFLALDVNIYVTRSTRSDDDKKEKRDELHEGMTMSFGSRPDLPKLIGEYIDAANGSVSMLHCGPDRMSDQIRQISAHHGVPYFEEAFNW